MVLHRFEFQQTGPTFTDRSSDTSLWTFFIRPILLLPLPAVMYASLTYGVTLGWCVIQATANATAFPELYNSSALGVGNINIGVRLLPARSWI